MRHNHPSHDNRILTLSVSKSQIRFWRRRIGYIIQFPFPIEKYFHFVCPCKVVQKIIILGQRDFSSYPYSPIPGQKTATQNKQAKSQRNRDQHFSFQKQTLTTKNKNKQNRKTGQWLSFSCLFLHFFSSQRIDKKSKRMFEVYPTLYSNISL